MILYNLLPPINSLVFIVLLLGIAALITILLKIGDIFTDSQEVKLLRLFYSSVLPLMLSLFSETVLTISGIEGGTYIPFPLNHFYPAFLPGMVLLYLVKTKLPVRNYFLEFLFLALMPLICLSLIKLTHINLAIYSYMFLVFCLSFSAFSGLVSLTRLEKNKVGYRALSDLIYKLEDGICLLDHKGRVIEFNPAFNQMISHLGLTAFNLESEYASNLNQLAVEGALKLLKLEDSHLIQVDNKAFLSRRTFFKVKNNSYTELSLTDVSNLTLAAKKLEVENKELENENQRLKFALRQIATEAANLERERLRRYTHDTWSQRLAIASFSVDNITQNFQKCDMPQVQEDLKEVLHILSEPERTLSDEQPNIKAFLDEIKNVYKNLGVNLKIEGQAIFNYNEQKVLIDILKEALANAVRHAYAKEIFIECFTSRGKKGIIISNKCLDEHFSIQEGQGLKDIKIRAQSAGGRANYQSGEFFRLSVIFPV